MSDYISRELVMDALLHEQYGYLCEDAICAIPSADVREVVRCADCKWFQCNMRQDGYLPKGVSECECRYWCGECDPTDFCSHWADMREKQT